VVNFNKLSNFGTGTGAAGLTFEGGTLQYASPASGGNTADITTSGKNIVVGSSGATIDVNGNSVAFNSASAWGSGSTAGAGVTFTDSSNGSGLMTLNSSTGYTGFTTIGNGTNTTDVTLGTAGNLGAGAGTIISKLGVLSGGTTQATSSSQSITTAYAGKIILQSGGTLMPGAIGVGTATLASGGIQGAGLSSGNYKGNQSSGVQTGVNNVMNATNLTWNAGGVLKFSLDNTAQYGTALNPSASTVLNLGSGALVKSGSGAFVLNFQGTGNWNTAGLAGAGSPNAADSNIYTNVYDLINFGGTSLTGGPNGDTNFNIDDFTIQNLNGVGTLSFWYNSQADGGIGQEELLLTVVPEPSTWAMLLGGLVALVFWTRRRNNSRRVAFTKTK